MRMIVIDFWKNHFSFLVILTSAIVYYSFNIWLKYILNDYEYGEYSLINSYITVTMSFSVLGGEQLLIRQSNITNQLVSISSKVMFFCLFLLVIYSGTSAVIIFFLLDFSLVNIFLCSFLSGLSILLFSLLRVIKLYTYAQIQKNIWKFIAFILSFFLFKTYLEINTKLILIVITVSILLGLVIQYPLVKNKLKINLESGDEVPLKLWIEFAFAMLTINLITNGDRFIIDNYIGREEVGEYFFLQNLFLFPLTQIQNYSGFRELAVFKTSFSLKNLNASLKRNLFLSLFISFILCISIILFDKFIYDLGIAWKANYVVILLLIASGIVRVTYSVLSSAMGAVGEIESIRFVNIIGNISILCLFIFINKGMSLERILLIFLALWLIRSFAYYWSIRRKWIAV
jgi:hypothetical protein